jgi:hypothetical protein
MKYPLYLIGNNAEQFVFGEFHPDLIELISTAAYRVYCMKTEEGSDYLVDHSIVMYVTLVSNFLSV